MQWLRRPWAVLTLATLSLAQAWSHAGPSSMLSAAWGAVAGPIFALASGAGGAPIYAAGAGGVWQRTESGWNSLGPVAPVSALAVTPAGTLIVATSAGLLTSSDGGASWQALPGWSGGTVSQIGLDPANAKHWLLATAAGLWATSDGGATFTATSVRDAVQAFGWQGANVLVVTAGALEVSNDAGATFTALGVAPPAGCAGAAVAVPGDGSFVVMLQGPNPELLSLPPGVGAPTVLALPSDWDATALQVALGASAGNIWLAGRDLWQQTAGTAWMNLTQTSATGATLPGGQTAVLPVGQGGVVVANRHGVWSWSGGASGGWSNWNGGLINPAPVAVAWTGEGNLVAALASGLVALGTGSGAASAWTLAAAPGLTALAADPAAPNAVYGMSATALMHSSDGGASWTTTPFTAATPFTALAATMESALVGTGGGGVVASSAGAVNSPAPGQSVAALAGSNDGVRLWLAADAELWSSGDGGTSWQTLDAPFGAVESLAAAGTGVLAAATAQGVELSWSGGNGWTLANAGWPTALPVTGLSWDAKGQLWAASYGQGLWTMVPGAQNLNLTLKIAAVGSVGTSVPFSVQLLSSLGPVAGATVTVSSSAGGVSGPSGTVTTGVDGSASGSLAMPDEAGAASVIASLSGAGVAVLSTPQAVQLAPGAPAELAVIGGANQQQTAGLALPLPVVLCMRDAFGNPLAGQVLQVTGPENFKQSLTTGSDGEAQLAGYRLPSQAGTITLSAGEGSVTAAWSETALPVPDYQISLQAPAAAAAPDATVALPLQIVAIGSFSAPVNVTCLPVLHCQITQAGQAISSLAPGVQAEVELSTGELGSSADAVTVSVQADSSHVASVSVPLQSLTLSLGASAATLAAGQTVAVPVTVAGINGLTAQVNLSVANGTADTNLNASLQPASLSLSSSAAAGSAQLELGMAAGAAAPPARLLLLGMGLALLAWLGRRRRIVAVAAVAALACACGGGAAVSPLEVGPPPPTQVTLTVTAQGGGLQTSATLPVTLTFP